MTSVDKLEYGVRNSCWEVASSFGSSSREMCDGGGGFELLT